MKHIHCLLVGAATLLCSCEFDLHHDESEATGSRTSAIVNGDGTSPNVSGTIAIYHQHLNDPDDWYWHPRPCSGIYLGARGGTHYILTARRCLTRYPNDPTGQLISRHKVRVTAKTDTGPYTTAAVQAALKPSAIVSVPGSPPGDMALVLTSQAIPELPSDLTRFGMYFGPLNAAFVDEWDSFVTYGFGMYAEGNNQSAGQLRYAAGFGLTGTSTKTYQHDNSGHGAGNVTATITDGDEGGPSFVAVGYSESGAGGGTGHDGVPEIRTLTGVHSTRTSDTATAYYAEWIQEQLDGVYLSSLRPDYLSYDVAALPDHSLEARAGRPDRDWSSRRFVYRPSDHHSIQSVAYPGFCFRIEDGVYAAGQEIVLDECSGWGSQKWQVTAQQQIQSLRHPEYCIGLTSTRRLELVDCDSWSDQFWLFHPMPSPQ